MATASQFVPLLTAEEFAQRPDPGYPEELVEGRIVPMPPPKPRHGEVCGKAVILIGNHVEQHHLGRVLSNDSGVITVRGPDTVRGADVAYYSYERVPRGPLPDGYLTVAPDLVIEVLSPDDRWVRVVQKVGEYLAVGVRMVVVLDPMVRNAHVYSAESPPRVVAAGEALVLPEIFGEAFQADLGRLFD